MRMWMIEPEKLCRKHLLGEHNEIHKLAGHLRKRKSITGWINHNCLEPQSIRARHSALVKEMERRGYNHQSPLPEFDISYLPANEQTTKVDTVESLLDLCNRCQDCNRR